MMRKWMTFAAFAVGLAAVLALAAERAQADGIGSPEAAAKASSGRSGQQTQESAAPDAKALENLWKAMADTNAGAARAAMWALAAEANGSADFLAGKLMPAAAADAESLNRLIADLGGATAAGREAAQQALASLDGLAEAALAEVARDDKLSAEARTRIGQLLDACRGPLMATDRSRQIVRAIWTLEIMPGPKGRAALEKLAKLDQRHRAAGLARAALARLDGQADGGEPYAPKLRYEVAFLAGQVKAGGSIPVEARLTNDGNAPVVVYWGDYAYEDMYIFAIRRGRTPVPAPRDRFCPRGGFEPRHFHELAPGQTLGYKMFLGSIGANCQRYYFRYPGVYTIEPTFAATATTCFDESTGREMPMPGAWTGRLTAAALEVPVVENSQAKGDVTVSGRVIDAATNQPLAEAKVVVITRRPVTGMSGSIKGQLVEEPADYAFTDANGRFSFGRLPEDVPQFALQATRGDHPTATAFVNAAPPKKQFQADILMHGGLRIGGRVVDSAGRPVAGARVNHRDKSVWTDKQGRFVLSGTTTTQHEGKPAVWVNVWKRGFVYGRGWAEPQDANAAPFKLVLLREEEMAFTGRVVFADGAPAEGLELTFRLKDAPGKNAYARGRTDYKGGFSVVLPHAGQFAGMTEAAGAKLEGYNEPRERWIAPVTGLQRGLKDVRIVFENRGSIRAHVTTSNPLPESVKFRVLCDLKDIEGQFRTVRSLVLDSTGGVATIDHLSPGEYRVTVTAVPQEHWNWTKEATIDANSPASTEDLEFIVPEKKFGGARVTVLMPDGKTAAKGHVWLDSPAMWGQHPIVDGQVNLKGIPVGRIWLTTRVEGMAPSKVKGFVRDGQTTDLGRIVLQTMEDATGLVEGRVLYDDGTPAVGARFMNESFGGNAVGADGKYSMRLPAGKCTVVVDLQAAAGWPNSAANMGRLGAPWGQELVMAPVDVKGGGKINLDIVLPRKNLIDLPIDFRGSEPFGVGVTVLVELDRFRLVRTWHTTKTTPGVGKIGKLPPGPTVVSLTAAGLGYRGCQTLAEDKLKDGLVFDPNVTGTMTVRPVDGAGKTLKDIAVRVLHEPMIWREEPVRGLTSDYFPIAGWGVAPDKTARVQRTLDDESIELTGLGPGAYIVQMVDDGTQERTAKPVRTEVRAGKDTSVRLVVETGNAGDGEKPAPATQPATATQPTASGSAASERAAAAKPSPNQATAAEIARLVEQLGSEQFAEREVDSHKCLLGDLLGQVMGAKTTGQVCQDRPLMLLYQTAIRVWLAVQTSMHVLLIRLAHGHLVNKEPVPAK